jgi:hypothetical protein
MHAQPTTFLNVDKWYGLQGLIINVDKQRRMRLPSTRQEAAQQSVLPDLNHAEVSAQHAMSSPSTSQGVAANS